MTKTIVNHKLCYLPELSFGQCFLRVRNIPLPSLVITTTEASSQFYRERPRMIPVSTSRLKNVRESSFIFATAMRVCVYMSVSSRTIEVCEMQEPR